MPRSSVACTTSRRSSAPRHVVPREPAHARPRADVHRRRVLRLDPAHRVERVRQRQVERLEQALAREQRPVQVALGERLHARQDVRPPGRAATSPDRCPTSASRSPAAASGSSTGPRGWRRAARSTRCSRSAAAPASRSPISTSSARTAQATELVARFLAGDRPSARAALVRHARDAGYRRLWLPDDVVELPAWRPGRATTRCTGCRATLTDGEPGFWATVRSSGCFPTVCPLCGSDLPQWRQIPPAGDDPPSRTTRARSEECT